MYVNGCKVRTHDCYRLHTHTHTHTQAGKREVKGGREDK